LSLAFVQGFATSAALIVAIGAQNAFVLRCGLRREHVLAVVLVCAVSDALLITLGIAGLGALIQQSPAWLAIARYGGAAFLIGYGALAARRAWRAGESLHGAAGGAPLTLAAAVSTCLAFTYLNPHCWLDTVVLLGSIAAQRPAAERVAFGIGATSASFVWFFALGFGARLLRRLFERPLAWRLLDALIALVMWGIAAALMLGH
jgi:L-lysine exporter family protein LysE/ArgO